jgi:diguanylate cyclase (GGDEF)-like protein
MNNLKHINDNFGHEEGNFAIKKLSEIIQNNLRDSDIFFRYGGDEFILLVNHCPKNYCKKVWNRIKSKIRSFNKNSNKPYKLSVSKGMVEYKKSFNLTAEELIKKADKKMYAEKKAYHKKND